MFFPLYSVNVCAIQMHFNRLKHSCIPKRNSKCSWCIILIICCCCILVVSESLRLHRQQPTRLCCPRDFPGKNTEVGCHFLLQGNLPDLDFDSASSATPVLAGGFFMQWATCEAHSWSYFHPFRWCWCSFGDFLDLAQVNLGSGCMFLIPWDHQCGSRLTHVWLPAIHPSIVLDSRLPPSHCVDPPGVVPQRYRVRDFIWYEHIPQHILWASLVAQTVKYLPAM